MKDSQAFLVAEAFHLFAADSWEGRGEREALVLAHANAAAEQHKEAEKLAGGPLPAMDWRELIESLRELVA